MSESTLQPPAVSAFRWPAEWEPMQCIWLAWPHNPQTWPGRVERMPPAYTRFVRSVSEVLPVRLLVPNALRQQAQRWLRNVPRVESIEYPTNDCWIRDYGPTFVHCVDPHAAALPELAAGSVVGIDWQYNAWGGKYPPWDQDAAAAETICHLSGSPRVTSALTLEGGALETDGAGRLLTTASCLVTDTRNPGWSRDQIAQELYRCLGVTEILWLEGGGPAGDDTDGHIDQIARFIDPENVVVAVCQDRSDPSYETLENHYRQIRVWARQTSPTVHVHRLPLPPARFVDGQRVPESYCNFLRLGEPRMLVPQFRSPASDRVALSILRNLAPGVEVLGVDAADLVWGLGALHCASQQQPQAAHSTDSPETRSRTR